MTDQLKTGETREQEVRESGERQREKREGKKERKEKQRFRDKENSFRVINKRTFFFFFFLQKKLIFNYASCVFPQSPFVHTD